MNNKIKFILSKVLLILGWFLFILGILSLLVTFIDPTVFIFAIINLFFGIKILFKFDKLKKLKEFSKKIKSNEYKNKYKKTWKIQLTSYDWFQPSLKNAFTMSGGHNAIISAFVEVVPEPNNKADPNAIAIYFNKEKIGYIPRDETSSYRRLNFKSNQRIRTYYYNEKYRAQFYVDYLF